MKHSFFNFETEKKIQKPTNIDQLFHQLTELQKELGAVSPILSQLLLKHFSIEIVEIGEKILIFHTITHHVVLRSFRYHYTDKNRNISISKRQLREDFFEGINPCCQCFSVKNLEVRVLNELAVGEYKTFGREPTSHAEQENGERVVGEQKDLVIGGELVEIGQRLEEHARLVQFRL